MQPQRKTPEKQKNEATVLRTTATNVQRTVDSSQHQAADRRKQQNCITPRFVDGGPFARNQGNRKVSESPEASCWCQRLSALLSLSLYSAQRNLFSCALQSKQVISTGPCSKSLIKGLPTIPQVSHCTTIWKNLQCAFRNYEDVRNW